LHRLCIATLIAVLFGAPAAHAALVDRVAAVVDEEVIALSEVYDLGGPFIDERCPEPGDTPCRREMELQVLDSLILRVLMRQELRKLGLDITAEEIDRTIDQIARDNGLENRDRLRTEVENAGMRWDAYQDQLREQLRQMRFQEAIIRPRITVTEDEMVDLYKRVLREFERPPQATVQALTLAVPEGSGEIGLVEAVARAREIRAQILEEELTWEEAVAHHHSGLVTAPDGSMPPVNKGELTPALDTAVFSTEPGEIAEPVVVAGTVFLVKVIEIESSGLVPYEEAEPQLREQVYNTKVTEQVEQWYLQARRQTAVKVLLEPAEPSEGP
jgi:peptidyl-prolyl cis-trans isomerase SurA